MTWCLNNNKLGLYVCLSPNTSSCAQCTVKPNKAKTSESGADKGLLQEHARKMSSSCPPKNSKLPERFQQNIFFFKGASHTLFKFCFSVLNNTCLFIYLVVLDLHCTISSFRCHTWTLCLWHVGSAVASHGLRPYAAYGILVPQPGIRPGSPALQGRRQSEGGAWFLITNFLV